MGLCSETWGPRRELSEPAGSPGRAIFLRASYHMFANAPDSERPLSLLLEVIVRRGPNAGARYLLEPGGKLVFGRSTLCDVQLNEQGLSRTHFCIERAGDTVFVEDLRSTNGTFVNGLKVEKKELAPKDLVKAGELVLELECSERPATTQKVDFSNGQWVRGEADLVKRFDPAKSGLTGHVTAVDTSKLSPQTLQRALRTLYQVSTLVNSSLDDRALGDELLSVLMHSIDADRGVLVLYDTLRDGLDVVASRFKNSSGKQGELTIRRSIIDQSIKRGLSIRTPDAMLDARFSANESAMFSQVRSVMCVPLEGAQSILGAIYLDSVGRVSGFHEEDLELLSAIGREVGIAYERTRLAKEVQKLFLSSIKALTAAIDAKDRYTRGHSERVGEFSREIAGSLGFKGTDVETVRLAGLLHDVGKIGIPERILKKPGKLTAEEFEIIKLHPVLSGEILGNIEGTREIVPGIRHHHERFDGKGYPEGLCGDRIPLLARLIFVADAFDAMTSRRAYRRNLSDEQAVEELQRCAGTQFDGEMVQAFVQAFQANHIHSVNQLLGPEPNGSAEREPVAQKMAER